MGNNKSVRPNNGSVFAVYYAMPPFCGMAMKDRSAPLARHSTLESRRSTTGICETAVMYMIGKGESLVLPCWPITNTRALECRNRRAVQGDSGNSPQNKVECQLRPSVIDRHCPRVVRFVVPLGISMQCFDSEYRDTSSSKDAWSPTWRYERDFLTTPLPTGRVMSINMTKGRQLTKAKSQKPPRGGRVYQRDLSATFLA